MVYAFVDRSKWVLSRTNFSLPKFIEEYVNRLRICSRSSHKSRCENLVWEKIRWIFFFLLQIFQLAIFLRICMISGIIKLPDYRSIVVWKVNRFRVDCFINFFYFFWKHVGASLLPRFSFMIDSNHVISSNGKFTYYSTLVTHTLGQTLLPYSSTKMFFKTIRLNVDDWHLIACRSVWRIQQTLITVVLSVVTQT